MQGMRLLFNQQALQTITKTPEIPLAQLGVGDGEDLTPHQQMVVYPIIQKVPVIPDISSISYERASVDGYAEPVKESDFPKTYFFGEALGGF